MDLQNFIIFGTYKIHKATNEMGFNSISNYNFMSTLVLGATKLCTCSAL